MIALLQVLLVAGLAAVLTLLARYGWQNADTLVPHELDSAQRARRLRAVRRGAAASLVVAGLLLGAALTSAVAEHAR